MDDTDSIKAFSGCSLPVYDRKGKRISFDRWAELHREEEYLRVDFTRLPGGLEVSTVWLGMDHSWVQKEPIIFETMVFGDTAYLNNDCRRYSTEDEAFAGHAEMVAELNGSHDSLWWRIRKIFLNWDWR